MSRNSDHITTTLKFLQKDLFDLSARNPLIQADPDKLWFTNEDTDFRKAQKIYRKSHFFEREYGLKTTLLVHCFMRWKGKRGNEFLTSPLIWQTIDVKEKKRETVTYDFSITDPVFYVNPILQKIFKEEFELDIPDYVDDVKELVDRLQTEFSTITISDEFTNQNTWQIILQKAIGIFNYKKILAVGDYEKIIENPNPNIRTLFGESEKESVDAGVNFESRGIVSRLDQSQKAALRCALQSNTVIQGPPGTGKSHMVVTLISTLLHSQKKVPFVSEKKSALDVVYQRLKKDKLDLQVACFDSAKDEKKQFYSQLRKAWEEATKWQTDLMHDATSGSQKSEIPGSDVLEFYSTKYGLKDTKNQESIMSLLTGLVQSDYTPEQLEFEGHVPDFSTWKQNRNSAGYLQQFFQHEFKVACLSEMSFVALNGAIFSEPQPLQKLSDRLKKTKAALVEVNAISRQYGLGNNLHEIFRFAVAGSILGMVNKNQLHLVKPDHKKFKSFSALAKKYQLTKIKLHQAEKVNAKWKKKPTISEITELTDLLKQKKKSKSILSILKRNSAKSYDYFADFSTEISTVAKLQLLEEIRTEWHLRGELDELKVKLRHDMGILDPDTEIETILQVRSKLGNTTTAEYVKILEHPDSQKFIEELSGMHPLLSHTNNLIEYVFHFSVPRTITVLEKMADSMQYDLAKWYPVEGEIKAVFKLTETVLNFLRTPGMTFSRADALVHYRELLNLTRFEPAYKKLNGKALTVEYQRQKKMFRQELDREFAFIRELPRMRLIASEMLAATPAHKVKPELKQERTQFKESKRILLHELKKRQAHLPILELMKTNHELVMNLQPVWMMNPLSVTQFLPCQAELFDYVIFDESSQVPLEDAIPAVYRGARLIVAGDSQQMPPGKFFSSNENSKTLLDQAELQFSNFLLTGHYRSSHPDLIALSNKLFYNNQLKYLPPVSNENPVELIRTKGIFEENKNVGEAKKIANYYANLLNSGESDVGIIAFSREQELAIEKEISALKLVYNENLIIRNLENVQGSEKEIILISIGYAKNRDGVLRKNFGPVNQDRGANRLNVLFTRAVKKMIVFSSIEAEDIGLSKNRGVAVLSEFLEFVDQRAARVSGIWLNQVQEKVHYVLKKNKIDHAIYSGNSNFLTTAFVQHKTGKVVLVEPCMGEGESNDLFATLYAMEKRFREIKIVMARDLFENSVSFEKEVLDFFGPLK